MATHYEHSYMPMTTGFRFQSWANLVLGVWLFVSPWVLQFGSGTAARVGGGAARMGDAAWNAWVLGVIVAIVALTAISRMDRWQEWLTLLLGAWIFIAPWVLGFTQMPAASWDHWLTGAVIFLISATTFSAARPLPPDSMGARSDM